MAQETKEDENVRYHTEFSTYLAWLIPRVPPQTGEIRCISWPKDPSKDPNSIFNVKLEIKSKVSLTSDTSNPDDDDLFEDEESQLYFYIYQLLNEKQLNDLRKKQNIPNNLSIAMDDQYSKQPFLHFRYIPNHTHYSNQSDIPKYKSIKTNTLQTYPSTITTCSDSSRWFQLTPVIYNPKLNDMSIITCGLGFNKDNQSVDDKSDFLKSLIDWKSRQDTIKELKTKTNQSENDMSFGDNEMIVIGGKGNWGTKTQQNKDGKSSNNNSGTGSGSFSLAGPKSKKSKKKDKSKKISDKDNDKYRANSGNNVNDDFFDDDFDKGFGDDTKKNNANDNANANANNNNSGGGAWSTFDDDPFS